MTAPSLLMAVIPTLLLSGCSLQQTASDILIVDGCIVTIKGLSSLQTDELIKTWNIEPDCQIEVRTEVD